MAPNGTIAKNVPFGAMHNLRVCVKRANPRHENTHAAMRDGTSLPSMSKLTLAASVLLASVYAAHLLLKMSFTMVKAISKTKNSPTRFSRMASSDALANDFDLGLDYRFGCRR